ncbi:glycine--tRNA ligase [Candidatus Woesearchaeota archaeon]|nr:glycine--tRNA ligase [Candidatus Woesearchaeota archaeon]
MNEPNTLTIEEMASFCKKKGFVYPSGEIYGGLAGFFDYGHIGVELKNNIKKEWWKAFVQSREDVVGIDGSIITNPKVWKASGHVDCFEDIMVEDAVTKERHRADQLVEAKLKMAVDGLNADQLWKLIHDHKIFSPKGNPLLPPKQFNLMFSTHVGPLETETSKAYLRPETAQLIFANFRLVAEHARMKLPFGIAQIGRSFRNEIAPRDFLFRCREFEQMEMEYFVHPDKTNECPYMDEVLDYQLLIFSAVMQQQKKEPQEMTVKDALQRHIIKTSWHAYWLVQSHQWFVKLGAKPENFRVRQHLPDEKSHYALDTWDLEYKFPFGWKELQGMANRTDFDLQQHMKHSTTDLSLFDDETNKKVVPHVVAEPAQGVDRAFLVFLFDAYTYSKEREYIVLKLHPKLAPVKVAVLPLVNKVNDKARAVFNMLKAEFTCVFDKSGAIGRRYARNDEIGTPYCVTIDFDSLDHNDVTIRERDTAMQKRVRIADLVPSLHTLLSSGSFKDIPGKMVQQSSTSSTV